MPSCRRSSAQPRRTPRYRDDTRRGADPLWFQKGDREHVQYDLECRPGRDRRSRSDHLEERLKDRDLRKAILLAVVIVPIWLALQCALDRSPRRGLRRLLLAVALFDCAFTVALYYLYLRVS